MKKNPELCKAFLRGITTTIWLITLFFVIPFTTHAQTAKEYSAANKAAFLDDLKNGAYDTLILSSSGGIYEFTGNVTPAKSVTIRAKTGLAAKPLLTFNSTSTGTTNSFIAPAAADLVLNFIGLEVNGFNINPVGSQPLFIRTQTAATNCSVIMRDCYLYNFNNANFNGLIRLDGPGSSMDIQGSTFDNCSGRMLHFYTPTTVAGVANYGDLVLFNNTFSNISGSSSVVYYRSAGGFFATGVNAFIDHCTFSNYSTTASDGILKFRQMTGVINLTNSIFNQVALGFSFALPVPTIDYCYLAGFATPPIGTNTIATPPIFADAASLNFGLTNAGSLVAGDTYTAGNSIYYISPVVKTLLQWVDNTHVKIGFNNFMEQVSAETAANYAISGTGGLTLTPSAASLDKSAVTLTIEDMSALAVGQTVVVTTTNLKDYMNQSISGNNVATLIIPSALLSDLVLDGLTPLFDKNTFIYDAVLPEGTINAPALIYTTESSLASAVVSNAAVLPGASTITVNSEYGIKQQVYTINFTVAKSTDAKLTDIKVDNVSLTGFSSDVPSYDVELPIGTTVVPTAITYAFSQANATAVVVDAAALPGTTEITVTAEDGTTKLVYKLNFTVALAPSTDASLSDIKADAATIAGFASGVLVYDIVLPYGTILVPTTTYTFNNSKATAVLAEAASLPGTTEITVTAQDATTILVYKLNFSVAEPSTDAKLSEIKVNGTTVSGFSTDVLAYNLVLPYGTTVVPITTFTVNQANASASIVEALALPGFSEITVTAQDGTTKLVYQLNFTVSTEQFTSREYAVADTVALFADLTAGAYDNYILTSEGGNYVFTKAVVPAKSLTIKAKGGLALRPILSYYTTLVAGSSGFLNPKTADLTIGLEGLELNGLNIGATGDKTQPILIKALASATNCKVIIRDCYIHDFNNMEGSNTNGLTRFEGAGSSIDMQGSTMDNCSGRLLYFYTVDTRYGDITLINNTFRNISGGSLVFYRTASGITSKGVNVTIDHCTFSSFTPTSTDGIFKFREMSGLISITNCVFDQVALGFSFANPDGMAPPQVIDNNYLAGFAIKPVGTNNLTVAPVFLDAAARNYAITNFHSFNGSDGAIAGDTRYYTSAFASTGLVTIDKTHVKMVFSKALDLETAVSVSNYAVSGTGGLSLTPLAAILGNSREVTLTIEDMTGLAVGQTVVVTATNLKDDMSQLLVGNNVSTLVIPSALLSNLSMDGTTISGFDKNTSSYQIELPIGTTLVPVISYTTEDLIATAIQTDAVELPGTTSIVVTAQDLVTKKTYTVDFTMAKSDDAHLADLQIAGATISGFDQNTLGYVLEYPFGTSSVPVVAYTLADPNATAIKSDAASLPGSTTIAVTAENGTTQIVYTITFSITEPSHDTRLSDVKTDGATIPGFEPGTYGYSIDLPYGTTAVPVVSYTIGGVNASAVLTNATSLPGTTTIEVTAEDGTTIVTYTIDFTVATGIVNNLQKEFVLYPNPATTLINLRSNSDCLGQSWTIVSVEGKIVSNGKIDQPEQVIDITRLTHGNYILVIDRLNVHLMFEKQ